MITGWDELVQLARLLFDGAAWRSVAIRVDKLINNEEMRHDEGAMAPSVE